MRNETDLKVAIARLYLQAEKKKEELLPGPPKTIIRFVRSTKAQNPIPEAASGRPEMKMDTPAQPKRPGLMQIAVDVVSRSDVASRAVRMWKENPAVRKSFATVADLYDALAEVEDHQAARWPGKTQEEKR